MLPQGDGFVHIRQHQAIPVVCPGTDVIETVIIKHCKRRPPFRFGKQPGLKLHLDLCLFFPCKQGFPPVQHIPHLFFPGVRIRVFLTVTDFHCLQIQRVFHNRISIQPVRPVSFVRRNGIPFRILIGNEICPGAFRKFDSDAVLSVKIAGSELLIHEILVIFRRYPCGTKHKADVLRL